LLVEGRKEETLFCGPMRLSALESLNKCSKMST
jgi:hypothetical protein